MITLFNRSRHRALKGWFLVLSTCFFFQGLIAQQRNPVAVSVNIIPPYSVYLADYISFGSNKLMATLVFNDFNELSRDVYIKIKIESNNLRIKSRVDYIPSKPITLIPGVPFQVSGDQLSTYFDFNNIDVSGMSKVDLSTNGRLIEGNYTFCFEVYDFNKHSLISNEACAMANIRLNDPPRLVLPEDLAVVPLSSPNINFQWQLTGGDPTTTKYLLSVYELSDYKISAMVAVQNNQAVKIFESVLLDNPFFIYDINSPLLKKGIKYAWRVQAVNINKRDEFKNKGFSLVRGFSYGYPENGKIIINSPIQGHAFSLRESKTFRWNAPDNLTPNQSYLYQTKLVKVQPEQSDSDAIAHNLVVYSNQSQVLNPRDPDYEVTAPARLFESQQKFAWQVTAHTNDQKIASSPIYNCYGPPLIEAFYAGTHTVFVTNTTSANINDLSGDGEVKISYSGTIQKVHFEHIKIESIGALLIMTKGFVKAKFTGDNINLKAEYAGNGKATFEADSVMIDTEYMRLKGIVNWVFPHPTIKPKNPFVKSVTNWIIFEDFVLTGEASLENLQVYELADPYGFKLSLDTTSIFILRGNNKYCPLLNGNVTMPKNVKNASGEKVILPFAGADRLDFINQQGNSSKSSIELLTGTGINLYASSYSFDFSESKSIGKLSSQPDWKGVYITNSSIEFPLTPDKGNQLFFKNTLNYSIKDTLGVSDTCWVTTQGLQFMANKTAEHPDTLWFNTFSGIFGSYGLTIQNSILTKGFFKGSIAIPLLSEKNRFPFTVPITEQGFATGFLDQNLDGSTIVFNPDGGEQKINLTINRAVFANKERLDLNVDLEWPLMDFTMKSLEGLKIWGNSNIGFQVPNGTTPLSSQIQSKIKGFEVTIDYIGCGRQENMYAFGTSAKIVMAEDISGPDGAPVVNIFSITENSLLLGSSITTGLPDRFQNILIQGGGKSSFGANESVGSKQNNSESGDSIDTNAIGVELNQQMSLAISELDAGGVKAISNSSLLPPNQPQHDDGYNILDSDVSISDIIALIDKVIPFLNDDQKVKAEAFKNKLVEYDQNELVVLYRELKDYNKYLKEIAKQVARNLVAKINKPILDQSKKIKASFIGFVDTKRDSLLSFIDSKIEKLVNSMANKAMEALSPLSKPDDKSAIVEIISSVSESVQSGITMGINQSISLSIKKNVTNKFIGIIDTAIVFKITAFTDSAILRTGFAIIDKGASADLKLDELGNQAINLLPSIGKDVFQRVTSINIENTIWNIISDSYKGIKWDSVGIYIVKQLAISLAEKTIGKKVEKAVAKAITGALGETGGEIAGALMKNVKLDFSNLGEKLRKGEFDKIIKFDPSYIVVPTPVANFEGWVKFTNDDPVWGDSWQATLTAKFKIGIKFTASAKYVNGSIDVNKNEYGETTTNQATTTSKYKNNFKYWFLEVGVAGLKTPLAPTPISLDGVKGKVFHHMGKVSKGIYMPADSIRFGAGLQLFMFDTPTDGSIIAFDVGAEITILDNGFIFEMYGDAGIGNSMDVKGHKVSYTLVSAAGYLGYNSIENHLVGNFTVTFNTAPVLCAGGELNVDIKPGSWFVSVGTREKPIFVDIFCTKHPIFKGWFAISNEKLDLGLMVNINIRAESPWIGLPGFKIKPWAAFKLDFGATAIVDFKPFAIEEAHVWLDIYAGIGVKYQLFLVKGDLTIAAINIGGEVLFRTVPKTYFKGEMHAKITVFNIGVGFSLEVEHEFS